MTFTLFLMLMVVWAACRLVRHEIAEHRSPSPRPGRGEGVSHGDPTAVTVDAAPLYCLSRGGGGRAK
jgi:hypothetical protein